MADGALASRIDRTWSAFAGRLPGGARRLAERIAQRSLLLEASSLGFYGLVSALPLLILTFTVVGAVAGEHTLERMASRAQDGGPAGVGQLLEQLLQSSGSMSWAAVVFALWPATAYGGGLRRALQRAVREDEDAPALRGRATALGLVFALPVLVLAGLPLAAFLTSLGDDGLVGTVLGWGLALVTGVAALTLVLTALYHAFSPARLGWWDTARGAALTATITTVFSIGFVAYLRLGDVEARFGGEVIGLVVMLGVYLFVANVLLLGGFEAVVELDRERTGSAVDDGARPEDDGGEDGDDGGGAGEGGAVSPTSPSRDR